MYLIFNLIVVIVCLITLEKQRKYYQNIIVENAEYHDMNNDLLDTIFKYQDEINALENWKARTGHIDENFVQQAHEYKDQKEKELQEKQARIDELIATCKEYLVMIDDAQKEVAVLQARMSQVESEIRTARGKMPFTPWFIDGLN